MMDDDDLELFERSLRHATEAHTGAELDDALDDIGWHDALAIDARAAVSILFELQGRANVTSSALGTLTLTSLGVDIEGAVVLPALGSRRAPGRIDGDRVAVHGLFTAPAGLAATAIVVAEHGEKEIAVVVATDQLDVQPAMGIDASLEIIGVSGMAAGEELGPADWVTATTRGQLAIGHELIGASRTMLDLAREHALERVQFGVPISSFQAVRHRLAETLVAIETAEAAFDAAWLDESPHTAAMAKALAGRGARTAARHCQQVLAGIGFTTEHPFHQHLRRVLVLDELFGSTRVLTKELGTELLRTRKLPAPLAL